MDNRLDNQNTRVQRRLDAFELRVTRQLGGGQAPDVVEIKVKMGELQNLVNKLNESPVFTCQL